MVYKNFRLQCMARIVLISVTAYGFIFVITQTNLYVTATMVVGLAVYQIVSLIRYVEKTNRDLTRFLTAIQHADFSQSFSAKGLGSSFDELQLAFAAISISFKKARFEKEEQYRYLQTVIQHIGIGLIVFQPDGHVELINAAAKRLLKTESELKNIKTLASFSTEFVHTLFHLQSGQKALVKIYRKNEYLQLAMYAVDFRMRDQKYTLISLQNIQGELEEKEMEAWQNLIRVLTHEIMNSITPITSLASTANDLLDALSKNKPPQSEIADDIRSALQTIQSRSQGLLHFVDAYRNLTRIPSPQFKIILIRELFSRIQKFMAPQVLVHKISVLTLVEPESLELAADPELIEQVLINLVLNAIQALQNREDARIELRANMDGGGRIVISVRDNGPGISEEAVDKIFIPFFTTKQDGSGIGLSLSRQIMRLHRGAISVQSKPNEETLFTLRF